jgi:hypothetical protein
LALQVADTERLSLRHLALTDASAAICLYVTATGEDPRS